MASKRAANRAYLEGIKAQLRAIPGQVAKEVAHFVFFEVMQISTEGGPGEQAGFDSGQAAANWVMQPYSGSTPAMNPQRMLWGYGTVPPIHPAGYKGDGDPLLVFSVMMEYGAAQLATAPTNISGVLIYNPITPGFAAFAPGDDHKYEENALGEHQSQLVSIEAKALAQGETAARRLIRGVR